MSDAVPSMPAELAAELAAAFGAFEILSPTSFSFAGEPPVDAASAAARHLWAAPPAAAVETGSEGLLSKAIQATLYDRCYAHRLGEARVESAGPHAEASVFARSLAE